MIPLLLAFLETARSVLRRTALIALILFFISLSVLTSSRVAVYGILLIGLLYLLRRPPLRISDVVSIAIVGAILLLIPVTNRLMNLLLSIDPRFATTILLTGSTLIRLNLALISFDMLFATFGAGIGGGNFPVTLDNTSTYSHRFTAAITDPHNWWLEILSEYGIIVFTLYAGFLAHLYLKSRVASRRQFAPIVPHLPLFFLAFALSGIGPSSFVNQSWQWLYLATIVIAATNTIRAPRNRNQLASANGSAISN